jgi:hypothetical protein
MVFIPFEVILRNPCPRRLRLLSTLRPRPVDGAPFYPEHGVVSRDWRGRSDERAHGAGGPGMTETTAKPAASESPGDLFTLLSNFASRMAILSSISEKERFWEDPTALKVGLSTYVNAKFLRNTLTTQLEFAESANGMLSEQIKTRISQVVGSFCVCWA